MLKTSRTIKTQCLQIFILAQYFVYNMLKSKPIVFYQSSFVYSFVIHCYEKNQYHDLNWSFLAIRLFNRIFETRVELYILRKHHLVITKTNQ